MSESSGPGLPAAPSWFRYRRGAETRLGVLDPVAGTPRWVDAGDLDARVLLAAGGLKNRDLAELLRSGAEMPAPEAFAPPVPPGGKVLCLARNYAAHAAEMGTGAPQEPVFFAKLPDSLTGHGEPVILPHWLQGRVDHEVELGVVLGFSDAAGGGVKYVPEERAMEIVAGYTVLVDVTARDLQASDKENRWPWLRSKSLDTFCPVGPWVVPTGALDPSDLQITLTVNDELRQRGSTSRMVHPVARIVSELSRYTTLRPGDLIATGTPEGVGPLLPGDRMTATIEGIGSLSNTIVREA